MRGRYFTGHTAIPRDVQVLLAREGLRIGFGDGKQMLWPWMRIQVDEDTEAGLGLSGPRGTLLELQGDDAELQPLRQRLRLNRHALGVAGWGLVAAGAVALTAATLLLREPVSVALAQQVPPEWETQLGQQLAAQLDGQRCDTARQDLVLERLVVRLIRHLPDPPPVDVRVVNLGTAGPAGASDGSDGSNEKRAPLFALPGGVVVIDAQLLVGLHEPEDLALLLAHEIEHARLRHPLAALLREHLLAALWAVVTEDYDTLVEAPPDALRVLQALRYSRRAEYDADAGALAMLLDARINPRPAALFLQRQQLGAAGLQASHPSSDVRVAYWMQATSDTSDAWAPPVTGEGWASLKLGCEANP